jgi:hypothetical protein
MDPDEQAELFNDEMFSQSQEWKLSTSGLSSGDRFIGTGYGNPYRFSLICLYTFSDLAALTLMVMESIVSGFLEVSTWFLDPYLLYRSSWSEYSQIWDRVETIVFDDFDSSVQEGARSEPPGVEGDV